MIKNQHGGMFDCMPTVYWFYPFYLSRVYPQQIPVSTDSQVAENLKKKTFDDWEKEERNEKNPLLTYEEYISEKFFRIIKKLDEARKNEND